MQVFRRKKSERFNNTDAAPRSVSGPLPLSSPSHAPLYERFASARTQELVVTASIPTRSDVNPRRSIASPSTNAYPAVQQQQRSGPGNNVTPSDGPFEQRQQRYPVAFDKPLPPPKDSNVSLTPQASRPKPRSNTKPLEPINTAELMQSGSVALPNGDNVLTPQNRVQPTIPRASGRDSAPTSPATKKYSPLAAFGPSPPVSSRTKSRPVPSGMVAPSSSPPREANNRSSPHDKLYDETNVYSYPILGSMDLPSIPIGAVVPRLVTSTPVLNKHEDSSSRDTKSPVQPLPSANGSTRNSSKSETRRGAEAKSRPYRNPDAHQNKTINDFAPPPNQTAPSPNTQEVRSLVSHQTSGQGVLLPSKPQPPHNEQHYSPSDLTAIASERDYRTRLTALSSEGHSTLAPRVIGEDDIVKGSVKPITNAAVSLKGGTKSRSIGFPPAPPPPSGAPPPPPTAIKGSKVLSPNPEVESSMGQALKMSLSVQNEMQSYNLGGNLLAPGSGTGLRPVESHNENPNQGFIPSPSSTITRSVKSGPNASISKTRSGATLKAGSPSAEGSTSTSYISIPPAVSSVPISASVSVQMTEVVKQSDSLGSSNSGTGIESSLSNGIGSRSYRSDAGPETPASSLYEFGDRNSKKQLGHEEEKFDQTVVDSETPQHRISLEQTLENKEIMKIEDHLADTPLTPSTSTNKVSYNPMPARRKADLFVDKRGRLILPPTQDQSPPSQYEEEFVEDEKEPTIYPFLAHLTSLPLFSALLTYLTFADFLSVSTLNSEVRKLLDDDDNYRESILERYLGGVGYWRWNRIFGNASNFAEVAMEPLALNLRDLNAYMRAVSIPAYRYADLAENILSSQAQGNGSGQVRILAKSSRAYTRVMLRLRAQADAEVEYLNSLVPIRRDSSHKNGNGVTGVRSKTSSVPSLYGSPSHGPSRAPSRTGSVGSSDHHSNSSYPPAFGAHSFPIRPQFRSPLYRPQHAPLLRVFVLSPEGPWLSDDTVLECEKELKRSCSGAKGRLSRKLLKVGDIVWNCAVSDEANLGRSIWDGHYLIDLDYSYSKTGAIPRYLNSLSFPPSYFHKVLRSGSGVDADPIVQIDISPFGEQIAANLQLLQERVGMETPQGSHHTVLRWTHRSKFRIPAVSRSADTLSIPIPNTDGLFVHAAWAGNVVVESEGTNEGLAELQARCGTAFPQFRKRALPAPTPGAEKSRVFRIMRERSRPGEIWIRIVKEKDKVL